MRSDVWSSMFHLRMNETCLLALSAESIRFGAYWSTCWWSVVVECQPTRFEPNHEKVKNRHFVGSIAREPSELSIKVGW